MTPSARANLLDHGVVDTLASGGVVGVLWSERELIIDARKRAEALLAGGARNGGTRPPAARSTRSGLPAFRKNTAGEHCWSVLLVDPSRKRDLGNDD